MRMLPFLLLALALPACGAVRPVQESLLLPASFGQPPQEALSVSACYRTLAKVDCYLEPQPAYRERRVGWFDAPSPHYPGSRAASRREPAALRGPGRE